MQDALRVLAMGLDFRRYVQFKSLVPHVSVTRDGTVYAGKAVTNSTEEEVRFCFDYVVDSAITLAEGPNPNTTP